MLAVKDKPLAIHQKSFAFGCCGCPKPESVLRCCAEENVMLVLRLGPFCHGEVYQGGIPSWVHEKAGQNPKYKIRARTPGFLEDCTKLYNTIFAQVNGLLWKDGGPVVGEQIDNESRGPWDYLETLKNIAVKAGFDVPFYTRTGWPALRGKEIFGQLLPLYGDYADGFWDRKLEDMPGSYADANTCPTSPRGA